MKKLVGFLFCGLVTFASCTTEEIATDVHKQFVGNEIAESDGLVYPLSVDYKPSGLVTKAGEDFGTNWESYRSVVLASGNQVATPWNNQDPVSTSVPSEYCFDIKKQDGWNIIVHSMYSQMDIGKNYIIFYNKYSGLLKGFYYLEGSAMPNNTGLWNITVEGGGQGLFDFSDVIATAVNSKVKNSYVCVANITKEESKGFLSGWNCFQQELAYDPNFVNGYLYITPQMLSTSSITLTGSYQSKSEGLIASLTNTQSSDGKVKGIVNGVGGEAGKWFNKQLAGDKFKKVTVPALTEGVKQIVGLGLNTLVSSFLGIFSPPKPAFQKLQFSTTGSVEMSGQITSVQTGIISPLRANISRSKVGVLGVWGIKETPIIQLDPLGELAKNLGSFVQATYRLRGKGGVDFETLLNPTIASEISDNRTKYDLVRYSSFPPRINVEKYDYGSLGKGNWGGEMKDTYLLYKDSSDPISVYMEDLSFLVNINYVQPTTTVHNRVFLPFAKDSNWQSLKFKSNHFCKLTHSFNVKLGGVDHTFVSTKTFVPRLEWHPVWYNNYKDHFPY